jgi:hypothetical protein
MPSFTYNANSNTRSLTYDSGKFHYLTVVLSNCLYNGSSFVSNVEDVEAVIVTEFKKIENLEFRGVGCSMMRGSTDSLTLGVAAGYCSDLANLTAAEALTLRVAVNEAITNVSSLTVSEVRVESTLKQILSF